MVPVWVLEQRAASAIVDTECDKPMAEFAFLTQQEGVAVREETKDVVSARPFCIAGGLDDADRAFGDVDGAKCEKAGAAKLQPAFTRAHSVLGRHRLDKRNSIGAARPG